MASSRCYLDLQSVKVDGHRYVVSSEDIQQQGAQGMGANKRTATMLGGGAALGTLIGVVAGGGKDAAVGALAGAAVGTGAELPPTFNRASWWACERGAAELGAGMRPRTCGLCI